MCQGGFGLADITGFDGTYSGPSVAHTLVVLMCGAKTGMIGMGRLYAVHGHVLGGDVEQIVFAAELSRSTEGLYFAGERPFGLPR